MKIQVLGTGCRSCKALYKYTEKAIKKSGLKGIELEMVEELEEIMKFGITSTPGFVIDGKLISAGKIWKVPQIIDMIMQKMVN